MDRTILVAIMLFSLTGPPSVLAEELAVTENPAETLASDTEASADGDTGTSRPMRSMGMMHKGKGQHCKSQHGKGQHGKGQHGKGQHGKGHGGMKHGNGHQGGEHSEKHRQVVQRLDMIEARMAKIEAMLEILMRR